MGDLLRFYDSFVPLLSYPAEDYISRAKACSQGLKESFPEAGKLSDDFLESISEMSTEALEELFTQTFDLNQTCSLDLGWHLFGEDYKRGHFMAKLRSEFSRFGLTENHELPDHVTNILGILGRMPVSEAAFLAKSCVIPALEKVKSSLSESKNRYESLVGALLHILTATSEVSSQGVSNV